MKTFSTALTFFIMMLGSAFCCADTTTSPSIDNGAVAEQAINEEAKDRNKEKDKEKAKELDDEDPDCE